LCYFGVSLVSPFEPPFFFARVLSTRVPSFFPLNLSAPSPLGVAEKPNPHPPTNVDIIGIPHVSSPRRYEIVLELLSFPSLPGLSCVPFPPLPRCPLCPVPRNQVRLFLPCIPRRGGVLIVDTNGRTIDGSFSPSLRPVLELSSRATGAFGDGATGSPVGWDISLLCQRSCLLREAPPQMLWTHIL